MTNDELKQFKDSLSITAVAEALGISVVRGRCHCLFPSRHAHGDRTPSVSVSEERGYFRCWVCQDVRGDVISLVQLAKDCTFMEALQWLHETFPFLGPKNMASSISLPATPKASVAPRDVVLHPAEDPPVKREPEFTIPEDDRKKLILSFLKMLSPVDHTPAAAWLARRKIFKPVWDRMLLRTIVDYDALNRKLLELYSLDVLKASGLFNDKGNLRYYKHPLIFPYLDRERRAFYFQARALDRTVVPKELNLRGTVPYPFNVSALDEKVGWIYLCEGVIDTLTFLGQSVDAVGIPGVSSFKVEWLPLFKSKNVVLCLDHDEAGRRGMEYLKDVFGRAGIRTVTLGSGMEHLDHAMKEGEDINEWFGGKK